MFSIDRNVTAGHCQKAQVFAAPIIGINIMFCLFCEKRLAHRFKIQDLNSTSSCEHRLMTQTSLDVDDLSDRLHDLPSVMPPWAFETVWWLNIYDRYRQIRNKKGLEKSYEFSLGTDTLRN